MGTSLENRNTTYSIINDICLKYAEKKCSSFAGDVHIIFNKSKSSDKERFMEMIDHLIGLDRILISDKNYVYNVHEFGNSLDKKKAYAEKFCELCNDIGIATTSKLLPYRPSAQEQLLNFYINQ